MGSKISENVKNPLWFFPDLDFAVRADWLIDMMQAFPDVIAFTPKDSVSPLGLKGKDGTGVILPCAFSQAIRQRDRCERRRAAGLEPAGAHCSLPNQVRRRCRPWYGRQGCRVCHDRDPDFRAQVLLTEEDTAPEAEGNPGRIQHS